MEYQTEALTPDHVDVTQPLSDDMKEWLQNRNRHDLLERHAQYMAQQASATDKPEPDEAGTPASPPEPDEDEDEDDYNNWTVKELAAEAEDRGLAKSGTKDELIARLRANDAENDTPEA